MEEREEGGYAKKIKLDREDMSSSSSSESSSSSDEVSDEESSPSDQNEMRGKNLANLIPVAIDDMEFRASQLPGEKSPSEDPEQLSNLEVEPSFDSILNDPDVQLAMDAMEKGCTKQHYVGAEFVDFFDSDDTFCCSCDSTSSNLIVDEDRMLDELLEEEEAAVPDDLSELVENPDSTFMVKSEELPLLSESDLEEHLADNEESDTENTSRI